MVPLSVHDYFDILGVSEHAPAAEIRRACSRRTRSSHPDFRDEDAEPVRFRLRASPSTSRAGLACESLDAAIDFVNMAALVDRMRDEFFADRGRLTPDLAGGSSQAR
jgi:hypothetical protein